MTIGSTQLSAALAQILGQTSAGSSAANTGATPPTSGSSGTNGLANTVLQALSQIGVATSQSSGSSQSASAALQSFLQSLLAALHSQGGSSSPTGTPSSTVTSLHGHSRHGGRGRLEASLKSLIGQLQSSNGTQASSGASGTSSLSSLQTSFAQLVSAYGGASGNSAGLGAFLNTLATDLSAPSADGQLVNVEA
ncbi:MAG: hypothetical protein ACREU3_05840 [Steroidobacteraceae bacterium]